MTDSDNSTIQSSSSQISFKKDSPVYIVGGGLAGSECAWQLAELGHKVVLIEMRGVQTTPAHKTEHLAELVCSNSLGSNTNYSSTGQLKWEAEKLNSLILKAAKESSIPAGMALGVDRTVFAQSITTAITSHPNITVERRLVNSIDEVPRPTVIATGPLTHESLANSIREHLCSYGEKEEIFDSKDPRVKPPKNDFLYFYDAIAPIIDVDSINMEVAWRGNRFDQQSENHESTLKEESSERGDYINCPLSKDEYFQFIDAVEKARKIEPKDFEKINYFDGCMPIEAMVERGRLTLKCGPMSSNGLRDPRTGLIPYAAIQLRQENLAGTCYNMVGFQTKMAYGDQKEVFRLIPGLENAEFLKLGSVHRNLYIHSPRKLSSRLSSIKDPWLFFAGQITGVEGYFDSTCIGLLVARILNEQLNLLEKETNIEKANNLQDPSTLLNDTDQAIPPRSTAIGSLLNAITEPKKHFQPTNINFGLFPPLDMKSPEKLDYLEYHLVNTKTNISDMNQLHIKDQKRNLQIARAKIDFTKWFNRGIKNGEIKKT
jgi:methylenetetrahydrofolate--tRNA-(uracil-5-)-methyltransferase